MRATILLMAAGLLVPGCHRLIDADEPPEIRPEELTWVAAHYAGGRQCNPQLRFTPPNVMTLLTQNNIYVHQVVVVVHPVCEQCDCLYYHGTHYAQIIKRQIPEARNLNFNESGPPPR